MNDLNKFTITIFTIGLLFLAYSQIAERIPINHFWESRYVGIQLLISTLITLAISRGSIYIGFSKVEWKPILAMMFQIVYIILISVITLNKTQSFKHLEETKELIVKSNSFTQAVGKVKKFGFVVDGEERSLKNSEYVAEYEFIVYGSKKTIRTKVGIQHKEGSSKLILNKKSR